MKRVEWNAQDVATQAQLLTRPTRSLAAGVRGRVEEVMADVAVRGDVASLIRSLHERAQQAESTRDAAQARATACEERARRAEAERDEWREKAHGAACDDNLMPLLAASVNGGE